MRFFTTAQHRFYCGIDLHARTMHSLRSRPGRQRRLRQEPGEPPGNVAQGHRRPSATGLVIGVGVHVSPGNWVADLCQREQITFVLGHALYMKAIHGGKAKNDKIDAGKIARLPPRRHLPARLRLPQGACARPADLLRRPLLPGPQTR